MRTGLRERVKEINDHFGHDVSDRALKEVTQILIGATRADERMYRAKEKGRNRVVVERG